MISSPLQCESDFLPWLRQVLGDPSLEQYQLDRLIPRRGPHDLRILVSNSSNDFHSFCFQIEPTNNNPEAYPLGSSQLVYRDSETELVLKISAALDEQCFERISQVCGIAVKEAQLLSYSPERRAVIHYSLCDGSHAIGKLYRHSAAKPSYEIAQKLSSTHLADSLVTALDYFEDLELILWKEATGKLLSDLFDTSDYPAALRSTGTTLRQLHDHPVNATENAATLGDELKTIDKQLERLFGLFPEKDLDPLRQLYQLLQQHYKSYQAINTCWVHGDFHDRQLIFQDEQPVILDLDGVCVGDPVIDVGNFLAHIDFRLAFEQSDQEAASFHDQFRQGYQLATNERGVNLSHAISLLRNAALYLLIPDRCQRLTSACRKIVARL
ncbi:MAG: aminoglycoside phosphotransferase family protein [Planctomycetota bacterium]